MTARVIVVSGTDAGVGKTFVTAAVCYALRDRKARVRAVKLVESAVEPGEPAITEDGVILAAAAGQTAPRAAMQRFRADLAAPLAAEIEGVEVREREWAMVVEGLAANSDVVFVEGSGGLLSPMSKNLDAASLAAELEAELLIVGQDARGTLNHTRLVLEAIERRNVPLLGVVLSAPPQPDASTGTNVRTLMKITGIDNIVSLARFHTPRYAASSVDVVCDWIL